MIVTRSLTKSYAGRLAVDHVDLRVERGSVFGLVGPNGAGKTTLLGLLAGLRRPTNGEIDIEAERRKISVLADTPQFDGWLTAWEVVDLARNLDAPELPASAVEEALLEMGLGDAADRRVGGFSRGMLQRLGLAAAVVSKPELLVLDEPCSALDPAGRHDVLDLVAGLAQRATVLLSTHLLDDVQRVCDTVGVLRSGKLIYQGSMQRMLTGRATRTYSVRLRTPINGVTGMLRGAPWVNSVEERIPGELLVGVTSLESAELELPKVLASAGEHVISLAPVAPTLESVFLELTA
jgi:ABC-2 type transport system ATP-binding protein